MTGTIQTEERWDLARQIGAMDADSAQVALLSLRLALLDLFDWDTRERLLVASRAQIAPAYRMPQGPELVEDRA